MIFLLLFMIMVLSSRTTATTVSDFQGKIFKFSAKASYIYEVNVGFDGFNGAILAYGDFNNDKAVDVLVCSTTGNLYIYMWNQDDMVFNAQSVYNDTSILIQGAIPADYNYDGYLDFLLLFIDGTQTSSFPYQGTLFINQDNGQSFPVLQGISNTFYSYPFVADFFGNKMMSVLYLDANGNRMICNYSGDSPNNIIQSTSKFSDLVSKDCSSVNAQNYDTIMNQNFTYPSFNSVVDVTLDCRADLIFLSENQTGTFLEFWYTNNTADPGSRYCLEYIEQINTDVEVISMNFNDINFDGLMDMALILSSNGVQYITVNYNNLTSQAAKDFCTAEFKSYPFAPISIENNDYVVSTSMGEYQAINYSNLPQAGTLSLAGMYAPYLRFGDYLCSGYPGALITVQQNNELYSYYVQNEANGLLPNGNSMNSLSLQTSLPSKSGFQQLYQNPSFLAAWVDYGENGRLDFLVNNYNSSTQTYYITAFYNYLSLDAFYLKSLGLNGVCASQSEAKINCVGALYYGATNMFSVTDLSGQYHPAVGAQLYQSSFSALQLPYAYMGLSRTNNYIEYFTYGIPLLNGQHKMWTPIIPNSQLIVAPYSDLTSWTLSIFIEPTDAILVVVIVTIIVLVLLGGVIIWKHIKEKEEDKKNQETFFQMFR